MRKITLAILMVSILSNKNYGIYILKDNILSGVVYRPFEHMHYQVGSETLSYKFNFTKFKNITIHTDYIRAKCPNKIKLFEKVRKNLITNWKEDEMITVVETKEISTPEMDLLFKYINSLQREDCQLLDDIEELSYKLNTQFNNVKNMSLDHILEIIPTETLMKDIENMKSKLPSKYIIPTSFRNFFVTEFINLVSIQTYFSENIMYTIFEIPYFDYNYNELYSIYPKPFIFDEESYILETNLKYAIIEKSFKNYYTKKEYEKYCFSTTSANFCKSHNKTRNSCDEQYINKIKNTGSNEKCFRKMKRVNKITQIENSIYFSLFEPLEVYIKHNDIDFTVSLSESSKIIEYIEYSIKTSFFYYAPYSEPQYKIYETNETRYIEKVFNFEIKINIIVIFIIFFLIMLFYTLIKSCYKVHNISKNI